MSFTPEHSAIRMTPSLEEQIASAGPEEIKAILHQAAIDQKLAVPDAFSPEVLIPTALADNAPRKLGKVVVLNGVKHILEATDEAGLLRAESELYREALQPQQSDTAEPLAQPRDSSGRFVSAEEAAALASLELDFKRGSISTDEYLTRSGAIERHLEAQGISPDALREVSNEQFAQSWASATEEFKSRHPEWAGGENNRDVIGQILADNNLVDAEDKVAALEAAYNAARENGLLVANPELELVDKINNARSFEEIRQTLRPESSGLFGR